MDKKVFTSENFDKLKKTCEKIILLSEENIDGNLMYSQVEMLGENLKEFIDNPIVKTSGVIK